MVSTRTLWMTVCVGALSWSVQSAPGVAGPGAVSVSPATLAMSIDELAGMAVEVSGARAVAALGSRALVIDTPSEFDRMRGHRDRVLVLIEGGDISVGPELLAGSRVRVSGTARTLLGTRLADNASWPSDLSSERLEQLEIRAAIVAASVSTADGLPLTR